MASRKNALTTTLRKVGGSVMLAVPPALLEMLRLGAGSKVDVMVSSGKLVVQPSTTPYTLEALLAQCDAAAEASDEDRRWLTGTPAGNELV